MMQPSPSIEYLQHPNINITRQIPLGRRLVIIGESNKGDLYHPTLVLDVNMATDIFGDGSLIDTYEDALTYQSDLAVYLMRIESGDFLTAFSVLESFYFDILFISEMHFDKDIELMQEFIKFAQTKAEKGNLIHGISTLSPGLTYHDLLNLESIIASLTKDDGDETIESGKYLSLVVNQGKHQDAGAVYAGLVTALDPEISPINKTIPEFELNQEFTKEEILRLRSLGVVCFKNTLKKGVTCTSSSCAVQTEGSVHKHISNFRIAQTLANQVAMDLQRFIGQPQILIRSGYIERIIESICMEFQQLNRIRDYDYHLTISELYGVVEVNIEFVPIFSVHAMTVHSRIRVYR